MGDGVISNDVATDVLVMMIVAVNQSWKIPIGHFFITGLSGMTRAKLVKDCLQKCQKLRETKTIYGPSKRLYSSASTI